MEREVRQRDLYPAEVDADIDLMRRTSRTAAYAEEALKRYRAFEADSKRAARAEERKCRFCFYLRGMGVQFGHERVNCRQCDAPINVTKCENGPPEVCAECSDTYGMCRQCGGDIDGNERRRKLERGKRR